MKRNHKIMIASAAAVAVLATTAVAASYITAESMKEPTQQARVIHHSPTSMQMAQVQPVQRTQPPCDDKNIIGTLSGGVIGGVIGNQFGSGSGKTLATVGGAAGGAYVGNQYIPTRGATCN